jgi:hypothetical protein
MATAVSVRNREMTIQGAGVREGKITVRAPGEGVAKTVGN